MADNLNVLMDPMDIFGSDANATVLIGSDVNATTRDIYVVTGPTTATASLSVSVPGRTSIMSSTTSFNTMLQELTGTATSLRAISGAPGIAYVGTSNGKLLSVNMDGTSPFIIKNVGTGFICEIQLAGSDIFWRESNTTCNNPNSTGDRIRSTAATGLGGVTTLVTATGRIARYQALVGTPTVYFTRSQNGYQIERLDLFTGIIDKPVAEFTSGNFVFNEFNPKLYWTDNTGGIIFTLDGLGRRVAHATTAESSTGLSLLNTGANRLYLYGAGSLFEAAP